MSVKSKKYTLWFEEISVKEKSFTLIELLVVIALVGLLATIIFVSLKGVIEKARLSKIFQFSQSIQHALGVDAIGIWAFDEGSGGTAFDNSGYGINGTIFGATWTTESLHSALGQGSGKWALIFDTDSVSAVFPNNAKGQGSGIYIPQGDLTFEMWFKTTSASGGLQVITGTNFGGGCDRVIWLDNGILNFNAWSEVNFAGTKTVNDGNWHHLAYVLDKNWGFKAYVDNELYASTQTPTSNCGVGCSGFDWADTYNIGTGQGCRGGASGGSFTGVIDEVRVYSRALTSSEIHQHYVKGSSKYNLVKKATVP